MGASDPLLELIGCGDWRQAETASLTRVESDPEDHYAWYVAGVSAHQLGKSAIAVERLAQAVQINGTDTEYRNNLGVALASSGRVAEAVAAYEQVLAVQPDRLDTMFNVAHALLRMGKVDHSIRYLSVLLRAQPDSVAGRLLLAQCYLVCRDTASAVRVLTALMAAAEEHPPLWIDIGNGLVQCEQFATARRCFERAIGIDPRDSRALNNLGNLLAMTGDPAAAVVYLQRALEANDDDPETMSNLACALDACGNPDRAAPYHLRALAAAPRHPHFNVNYAIHLLRAGQVTRALPHYRFRFEHPAWAEELDALRQIAGVGDHEEFEEHALVVGEQGIGDEVYLLQSLGQHRRPGAWSYVGDERLRPAFERSFPEARFVPRRSADLAAIISDARRGWRLDHVLARHERLGRRGTRAVLRADEGALRRWREQLVELGEGPKIGISWTGGKFRKDRLQREIVPELWAALRSFSGGCFVDIQYDDREDERGDLERALGHPVHRPEAYEPIFRLDDSMALYAALDLLITVDNSTAHLAGALGARTWLLLATVPDWRWGTPALPATPYPRVRAYRQETPGNWGEPLRAVARDLIAELA